MVCDSQAHITDAICKCGWLGDINMHTWQGDSLAKLPWHDPTSVCMIAQSMWLTITYRLSESQTHTTCDSHAYMTHMTDMTNKYIQLMLYIHIIDLTQAHRNDHS